MRCPVRIGYRFQAEISRPSRYKYCIKAHRHFIFVFRLSILLPLTVKHKCVPKNPPAAGVRVREGGGRLSPLDRVRTDKPSMWLQRILLET